jgi:hypothetical protein
MGKREKQRLAAQQAAGGEAAAVAAAADASAAERDFTKLTELADLLLNAGGELDVYSHRKEQLQRWADAVLPQTNVLAGVRDKQALHDSSAVCHQSCELRITGCFCACCWQGECHVGRYGIDTWRTCNGLLPCAANLSASVCFMQAAMMMTTCSHQMRSRTKPKGSQQQPRSSSRTASSNRSSSQQQRQQQQQQQQLQTQLAPRQTLAVLLLQPQRQPQHEQQQQPQLTIHHGQ